MSGVVEGVEGRRGGGEGSVSMTMLGGGPEDDCLFT